VKTYERRLTTLPENLENEANRENPGTSAGMAFERKETKVGELWKERNKEEKLAKP